MRPLPAVKSRALVLILLLLSTAILSQEPPRRIPDGMFLPNFRDVEIADFLKTMAQVTRRNILVDDSIKGKITVVAYKPIPVSEALAFMKRVLEVRGFAVIEEGGLIKISKTTEAVSQSETKSALDEKDADIITSVYRVPEYASVNEILAFFQKIGGKDVVVEPFRSSNTIVLSGYAPRIKRMMELAGEVLPPEKEKKTAGATEGVHIYQVMNLQAESLASVLVKLDAPVLDGDGKDGKPPQAGKIRAVAHKESNTIIITAGREEWTEIRRIIEQLDRERKQILLEVLIAEVSGKDTKDFGIDWRVTSTTAGHSQFNSGLAVEGSMLDSNGNITGNNTLSGFSVGFLKKGGDLLGIFNANIANQNFNVLSAPQILTLDNQEAEINVGQDVPVKTQERTSGGGTSESTVNSFEYRPSGIKLKFTPNINSNGNIVLELFSEVTNIEGGSSSTVNPTFNKRNIKTFITVDNGQTVVIGGLVSTERLQAVKKIPLLGDIPLLGFIFRRTTFETKRTNLMVFLTPIILNDRETADGLTRMKRSQQIDMGRILQEDIRLWPQKRVPLLREENGKKGQDHEIYIFDPENRPAREEKKPADEKPKLEELKKDETPGMNIEKETRESYYRKKK
jgi:general secretion pathway protein D